MSSKKRKAINESLHTADNKETKQRTKAPTSLDVLLLPTGWTEAEADNLLTFLDLAQTYVSRFGFFVFQKDKEFHSLLSSKYSPVSFNAARLVLLYSLTDGMFELGRQWTEHGDDCKRKVECVFDKYFQNNKDSETLACMRKLWEQLLQMCPSTKQIILTISKLYEPELFFDQDTPKIFDGVKGWIVILLLDPKTKMYIAHVFQRGPHIFQHERCRMVGIRQSYLNALARNPSCKNKTQIRDGAHRIAHRLLTQALKRDLMDRCHKSCRTVDFNKSMATKETILSHWIKSIHVVCLNSILFQVM